MKKLIATCLGIFIVCTTLLLANANTPISKSSEKKREAQILNAGFVCVEKVYNSELMAPYDVLQHSVYRDSLSYIRCFIVTPDGQPFVTFEGIRITPDYSFANAPPIDILVIPSTETSMSKDLENTKLMAWLRRAVAEAKYVITLCDGAFPLAATGVLNGRVATTFPADRKQLAQMFPKVKVRDDVNFAVDGKYITSVGGALSYEPALYLVEKFYSKEHAKRTGVGLVLDWDLSRVPHVVVEK
jgi:transcriptional regulator GlxA family with amidase domain